MYDAVGLVTRAETALRAVTKNTPERGREASAPADVLSLRRDNRRFQGTGGVSQHNAAAGFRPAFYDRETGHIYLSRFADGRPAPVHLLHRLPREVVSDSESGALTLRIKLCLISGFVLRGQFYTRQQVARLLDQPHRLLA